MGQWDGKERRGSGECCIELESRVRYLEAYREQHEKSIDSLTRAVESNNTLLSKTINKLTEVKTDQRNTHALAGIFGAAVASAVEYVGRRLLG